jgi:hypothetical protein
MMVDSFELAADLAQAAGQPSVAVAKARRLLTDFEFGHANQFVDQSQADLADSLFHTIRPLLRR